MDSVDSIDSTNHSDSLHHSDLPLHDRLLTDHPHWQPFDLRATLYPQAPSHQPPIATYFDQEFPIQFLGQQHQIQDVLDTTQD